MGKLTISMAMFNSYVSLPEGITGSFQVLAYPLFGDVTKALVRPAARCWVRRSLGDDFTPMGISWDLQLIPSGNLLQFAIEQQGLVNVPIEHHPSVGDIISNRYLKVMFKIPKKEHLPTPEHGHR